MIFFSYGFMNRNAYFELWIGGFGMHIFNTIIHVLLEAPIREITRSTNLGDYQTCQSKILPEATIRKFTGFYNPECKKINVQFLYGDSFIFAQYCGVQEEKL